MKFIFAASLLSTACASQAKFTEFKAKHAKTYESAEEESKRFAIFSENLDLVDARNKAELALGGDAIHGVTKFSDMSQEEFVSFYNNFLPAPPKRENVLTGLPPVNGTDLVDWTGTLTTPVKDQAQCGSCWAFSATEQFESDIMRVTGTTLVLSPQQIVSCSKVNAGCNGGNTETAYSYVKRFGGQELESDYPYTSQRGVSGSCSSDAKKAAATMTGYTTVDGEDNMASYVSSTGPLSVCVDASTWNSYTGGVMKVCGSQIDHCVQAVGVMPDKSTGYWKVRNSWNTDWGEDGFIRLAFGKDTCALANDPTYLNDPTLL
ncbi:hypothetical protein ScalyP_jg568 [Parmales sp. scaly parma]|nr:hypothetical protein ScalyP_jg568 [Parmales sp. scaly parma]